MDGWFLVYMAGSMQAALLALTLWQRHGSSHPSRLLAGWMALLCIDLGIRAWAQGQPPLIAFKPNRLVSLLPFLHGSLFYLYVRTVISDRPLRWPDLRHAVGFLLALLLSAPLFLLEPTDAIAAYRQSELAGLAGRYLYIDIGLFVWSLSYVGLALWTIRHQREQLRATRSDSHPDALRWLMVMAICQCLIWAVALASRATPIGLFSPRWIYVAVAGWVLLVGYYSLLHGSDAIAAIDRRDPTPSPDRDDHEGGNGERMTGAGAADADDPRSDAVAERLQQLLEDDALYREPALSIARLARRSGYPEYLVSAVINRRFGCPFWDYVNRYRVAEAQACLLDARDTRTALEIAYACGFTSKSTFNVAFKRLTGETPSTCRARAASGASAATIRRPAD